MVRFIQCLGEIVLFQDRIPARGNFRQTELLAASFRIHPPVKRRPRHARSAVSPRAPLERLERRLVLAAPAIGMNMDQVVDWAAAWTFTDAFKASRDWF